VERELMGGETGTPSTTDATPRLTRDLARFWHHSKMTEIPARLSIVTLGARNMGDLRAFYRALGWPELPNGDDTWTGFHLGGVLLALFPLADLTAEAAPGSPDPTGWSGVTLACTVSTRDEVDATFAGAVAAGATPVADATDRSWGGRSAFIADPEGNRWEITWSPRATFDARGGLVSWG
jgi:catechol 2,3-dioxygenase-like lactoylglutathione lyase family enzyme